MEHLPLGKSLLHTRTLWVGERNPLFPSCCFWLLHSGTRVIIPTLQMRKLRLREVMTCPWSQLASSRGQIWSQVSPLSKSSILSATSHCLSLWGVLPFPQVLCLGVLLQPPPEISLYFCEVNSLKARSPGNLADLSQQRRSCLFPLSGLAKNTSSKESKAFCKQGLIDLELGSR